jgi:hypothetical protein
MHVLRIEHPVPNFDSWKIAFDSDPIGRKQMGVRRYHVYRPTDDPNYALIDLEFDSASQAEACLSALRTLWSRVQGSVMNDPRVRILNRIEERQP